IPLMAIVLASGIARAELSAKSDYIRHCADCHGVDGKGKGPEVQVVPGYTTADLTQLSAAHNGEFPREAVYDTIDGRKTVPAHMRKNMPVWGYVFQPDKKELSPEADAQVKRRISALVDYIQTLQTK
ncbi:MAG TPA: c-type cytochrome, partial [Candidatus Binataceae bacterium]|nr:c-type cytochrome [Candidatus Binataceae bacterium]